MQTFMTYLDAVSMYNGIMQWKLPSGYFYELKQDKEFLRMSKPEVIMGLDDDDYIGYGYEVDGYFPDELHDKLNDLPPLCENRYVEYEELSESQINIRKGFNETEAQIRSGLKQAKRLVSGLTPVIEHFCVMRGIVFVSPLFVRILLDICKGVLLRGTVIKVCSMT